MPLLRPANAGVNGVDHAPTPYRSQVARYLFWSWGLRPHVTMRACNISLCIIVDQSSLLLQPRKTCFYLPLRIVPPALLAEGGGRGGRGGRGKLDLSKIRAVGTIRLKTKLLLG